MCVWKCVVIFILKHWGVRWREEADEGRRRGGGGGVDFPLELTGLSLSSLKFFFLFQFFICLAPVRGSWLLCVSACVVNVYK